MILPRLRPELRRREVIRSLEDRSEHERHASWLELFYDLAFVATIGQLATTLASHFTMASFGMAAALFVPIWWGWVGQTFYLSRFDSDDLEHRLTTLLQIFLVVAMAVYIPQAMEGNLVGFMTAFVLLRLTLIGQYLATGAHIPEARALTGGYSAGFGLALVFWGASAFAPVYVAMLLWLIAISIDFVAPFLCRQLRIDIPPDYGHFPERFGLFTIIVLGEGILGAVNGLRRDLLTTEAILCGLIALLYFCCMWWIYFEGVRGATLTAPRTPTEGSRTIVWLYTHLPLQLCLMMTAVGFKKIIALPQGAAMPTEARLAFCGSVFVLMCAYQVIWYTGLNKQLYPYAHRIGLPHVLATLSMVPVTIASGWISPLALCALLGAIGLAHFGLIVADRPAVRRLMEANERAEQGLPHEFALFG